MQINALKLKINNSGIMFSYFNYYTFCRDTVFFIYQVAVIEFYSEAGNLLNFMSYRSPVAVLSP